ncbi:hypothetical protein QBC40DRAFT_339263 [Triangularia verruculosa]|uniref:AA1-like domain-containing protein n=1 Tax=Triangularia verruculosa TaxID=2587418 RepID=A0AAN6XIA2_9PEZI|nr:hypothetical protein QBC40DRAFT_339263 [Triangularia verruculosa]
MKSRITAFITFLSLSAATPHKRRDGKCGGGPDPITMCTKTLEALKWTVHDFDFHASYVFTNPAHQNSWGYMCRPAGARVGFKFSRPAGTLEISETVGCSDKLFVVNGGTTLTLTCTGVTTQNPNWTPGQIYSSRDIRCTPVDATIEAENVTAL